MNERQPYTGQARDRMIFDAIKVAFYAACILVPIVFVAVIMASN